MGLYLGMDKHPQAEFELIIELGMETDSGIGWMM